MVIPIPAIAMQNSLPEAEVAIGTAIVVFSQFFGGAVFVSLGQTVFLNRLAPALAKFEPTVSAASLIEVGATSVRSAVSKSQLEGVLKAYNLALTQTFVSLSFSQLKACSSENERTTNNQI